MQGQSLNEIKNIDLKIDKYSSKDYITDILQKSVISNYCSYKTSNDIKYIKEDDYLNFKFIPV